MDLNVLTMMICAHGMNTVDLIQHLDNVKTGLRLLFLFNVLATNRCYVHTVVEEPEEEGKYKFIVLFPACVLSLN